MTKFIATVFIFALFSLNTFAAETLQQEIAARNALFPGTCQAWTDCLNPYGVPYKRVFCYSEGPACTWYVQPYQYVLCTGYDQFGNYYQDYQSCF